MSYSTKDPIDVEVRKVDGGFRYVGGPYQSMIYETKGELAEKIAGRFPMARVKDKEVGKLIAAALDEGKAAPPKKIAAAEPGDEPLDTKDVKGQTRIRKALKIESDPAMAERAARRAVPEAKAGKAQPAKRGRADEQKPAAEAAGLFGGAGDAKAAPKGKNAPASRGRAPAKAVAKGGRR